MLKGREHKADRESLHWQLVMPLTLDDLVFANCDGQPIDPSVLSHNFGRIVKSAGLSASFHDLRHTYASLLIEQGEHPKYIQVQMGHSSINVTMDTYGHLMKPVNQEASRRLDKIVGKLATGTKKKANERDERNILFTQKETFFFILKQTMIFLFGTIHLVFAVFISFYSLMMSGKYINNIANRRDKRFLSILGNLLSFLSPLIGILWYTLINPDYYSVAAIGVSIIAFFHYGIKISSLSLTKMLEKYSKRRIEKIPKIIQYILLIF